MRLKRDKNLIEMEMGGILFCALYSLFVRHLYALSGGGLIGVLFGSVNSSPWEQLKTVLLPYLLWGMLELLCVQPSFKRLTAAKTATLWLLTGLLSGGGLILRLCGFDTASPTFSALSLASLCLCAALSLLLYFSSLPLAPFFAPCVFLLFLFLSVYFSLTPFPPHHLLFEDCETGLRGLIPPYIDKGAAVLDALFQFNS